MHSLCNGKGVDDTIALFNDFLKKTVSGLNILFNNSIYDNNDNSSLGNWIPKDSNGNGSIKNYNCNY